MIQYWRATFEDRHLGFSKELGEWRVEEEGPFGMLGERLIKDILSSPLYGYDRGSLVVFKIHRPATPLLTRLGVAEVQKWTEADVEKRRGLQQDLLDAMQKTSKRPIRAIKRKLERLERRVKARPARRG